MYWFEHSADSVDSNWKRHTIVTQFTTNSMDVSDMDNDGDIDIVTCEHRGTRKLAIWENDGNIWGEQMKMPGHMIQIWKRVKKPSTLTAVKHTLLDRDKPDPNTDILSVDIDGDGKEDVVCGHYWYQNPTWKRYEIPGIYQVHYAYDIDHDGKKELIATNATKMVNLI